MKRLTSLVVLLLVFGIAGDAWVWTGSLFAQEVGKSKELSPGRVRVNLGEVSANVPGYEKVRIVEDTAQPGATWNTPSMPVPMFCTLRKGEITVKNLTEGKQITYKAGDSWVCPVGIKTEAKSTGSEPSVMRMHHLLKPGDKSVGSIKGLFRPTGPDRTWGRASAVAGPHFVINFVGSTIGAGRVPV